MNQTLGSRLAAGTTLGPRPSGSGASFKRSAAASRWLVPGPDSLKPSVESATSR